MSVRVHIAVVTGVAVLALAGCGSGSGGGGGPAGPAGASTVTATEADNGRTITLAVGDHLVVRLASTYWRFAGTSAAVLSNVSAPAVAASAPGVRCVPGGGCGTVTAAYLAIAPGEAVVGADRTSCGEARACTGGDGTYRLDVRVH